MPEEITPENLLQNVMETLSDGISRQNSGSSLRKETPNSVTFKFNKLFDRQKPVHHILGGGKCKFYIFLMCGYNSQVMEVQLFLLDKYFTVVKNYICYTFYIMICLAADVLLWRNKKISASVISGFTAVWVLFEWLNYHFLQLFCFAVVLGMLGQFVLSNASGILKRYL